MSTSNSARKAKPVILCILDGWGLSDETQGNAPRQAQTPCFDGLMARCPHATLITHGPDAGLPKGQMGNSEVGHTNIGAGRVVAMDLGQIDLAIEDQSFYEQAALLDFIATLQKTKGRAHLIGVMSDGGVHGHLAHIIAAAKFIHAAGVETVLHLMSDGRDVAPSSAKLYAQELQDALSQGSQAGGIQIGTLSGRYFAMDRDNRWERVEKAYVAMARGDGLASDSLDEAIAQAYERGETDEFITPTVLQGYRGMKDDDGIFCLNFRADRARELLAAFGQPDFDSFDIGGRAKLSARLGMVDYSSQHNRYMTTVFPKRKIVNTLGEWVARQGLSQFRIAETEKYPHVTFFLNGGQEQPETGEARYMPESPKVATYDLQPEMSAGQVTQHLLGAIEEGYDLIVVNYANPDMVGHTGDMAAAVRACEAVDQGLSQVVAALEKGSGAMIVTADHGNCETMIDPETGGAHTAHTLNPVPVILYGGDEGVTLRDGRLADLAPTVLELLGLEKPDEMTGRSLICR